MLDSIVSQVGGILSMSVCGISVATIIGMIIYCIRLAVTNKKNLQVTIDTIEEAFKNVVLPKNIKLDISNKIEKPIQKGLQLIAEKINGSMEKIEAGEKMMMKILVLFTHFQKLPEEVREEIEDFINEETTSVDVTL